MKSSHNEIFNIIRRNFEEEDKYLYQKCCILSSLKVTPDQFGVPEGFCIPLPATVVELASLDMHDSPTEKLKCLSTAFDLALAELKGALIDVFALNNDNQMPVLNKSDVITILTTLLVSVKPLYLTSNLYFIENVYFSTLTESERECLSAFKEATHKLKSMSLDELPQKNRNIFCNIGLEDISKLIKETEKLHDRKGRRIISPENPLKRHIEIVTNLIITATFSK